MQHDAHAPYTHGMEVEQFPNELPDAVRNYTMNNYEGDLRDWHDDLSGPRETSLGPAKNVKSILTTFYAETRDQDITWDWHASNGSAGAGSHVHLCMAEDVFDDEITGWTITYNTSVELFPFLAPYFCHNWQEGFRDGTSRHGGPQVGYWASPTTTRYARSSIRDYVDNPHGYSRSYDAVTFNSADGEKPVTVELRANDAHPAMALNGLLLLRRVAGRAVEGGWSPKLENHTATLEAVYEKVYDRARDVGLMTAMQEPIEGGITFQAGRGIPGVDQHHFETAFEVLRAIQQAYPQTPGSWRARTEALVAAGEDAYSPANNADALWYTDAPVGEFAWEHGPDVGEEPDVEPVAPTADDVRELAHVGEGRAAALEAAGYDNPRAIKRATVDALAEVDTVGRNVARKLAAQVDGVPFAEYTEADTDGAEAGA